MLRYATLVLIISALLLGGCAMQWKPAWQPQERTPKTDPTLQPLVAAEALFNEAQTKQQLEKSINAYELILTTHPNNYTVLQTLSTQYILLGTAYTIGSKEKSQCFKQAMRYAEWAMYTNPEFRHRIEQGETPWAASSALTANEAEAMLFWVTALQYEFKEGMNLYSKIININWLKRALIILERIETVAPQFGGGAVEFAKAICYYALPSSKGGDKTKGDIAMQQAVARNDNWLLPRWAMGKYYHPIRGEHHKAQRELTWVARQDLNQFIDPFPWRVHFRENAQQLLNE